MINNFYSYIFLCFYMKNAVGNVLYNISDEDFNPIWLKWFGEYCITVYWIHGHIHTPARYKINTTEVICNPHGYIDEKYNGYIKELIIEI